jgi:membrane protein
MWVVMLLRGSAEEALQWIAAIMGWAMLLLGVTAMVRCSKRARAKGKKMKRNAVAGLVYVVSSGSFLSQILSSGLQTNEHWSMVNLIQAGFSAGPTDVDFVNGVMGAYGVPGLVALAVHTVLFFAWGMLVPEVLLHSVFLTASALGGRAVIVGSKLESAQRLFSVSVTIYLVMSLIADGLLVR